MAAKKTLYVPDQDTDKWKELEELSGESSSAVVGRLLGAELERLREAKKAKDGKFSRLVVSYTDDEGMKRKVAFVGRWIVKDYYTTGVTYSVALTENERLFVLIEDSRGARHIVYDSFEEMADQEGGFLGDVLTRVAAEIGEDFVEELDI